MYALPKLLLQGDSMTWEIHLGTRLSVKLVPSNIFNSQYISDEWPVRFEKNAFQILIDIIGDVTIESIHYQLKN